MGEQSAGPTSGAAQTNASQAPAEQAEGQPEPAPSGDDAAEQPLEEAELENVSGGTVGRYGRGSAGDTGGGVGRYQGGTSGDASPVGRFSDGDTAVDDPVGRYTNVGRYSK